MRGKVKRRYAERGWLSTMDGIAASCCKLSARAACCAPVSLVNQRPLRATRWESPPRFRFRPHNTLGDRPPAPAGRAFPTLSPQPLPTLALGAGLN